MSVTCLQRRIPPPPILTGFSFTCSVNTQTANHCYQYNTFSLCNQEAEFFLIGQSERKNYMLLTSELEARPVYVWTKEHIEAHFLTCFVALTIARILENKLERKYSIGTILESLSKAKCSLIQQNYYLFDYYDEVLKDIERVTDIDFGKRIRTLGEIKKVLAKTQK